MTRLKDVSDGRERSERLPCDGCDYRNICTGACGLLHKFLRDDPKCHTRFRTTELILPPGAIQAISDWQIANPTRLSLAELAEGTPGYWDIMRNKKLLPGEKELLFDQQTMGMSYQQIAKKWRISIHTVQRRITQIRKKLRTFGKS